MAQVKFQKIVSSLPESLAADTIYFVRVGAGFDLYVTNKTGTIVAYALNTNKVTDVATAEDIPADAPLDAEYRVTTGEYAKKIFRVFDDSVSPHKAGEMAIAGLTVLPQGDSVSTAGIVAVLLANKVAISPPKPLFASKSETDRLYTFTSVPGHTAVQHEYNLRNTGYADCTSNSINVGAAALLADELLIRVKARAGVNAGDVHSNTETFAAGGSEIVVTYENTAVNANTAPPNVIRIDDALDYRATSVQTITPNTLSYFKFTGIPLGNGAGYKSTRVFLLPNSEKPLAYPNSAPSTGIRFSSDDTVFLAAGFGEDYWDMGVVPSDEIWIGYNNGDKICVWKNSVLVKIFAIARPIVPFCLFVHNTDDNNSGLPSGLMNVRVVGANS